MYKREWALPTWFSCIKSQDWPLSDIGFVFVCSSNDTETIAELEKFRDQNPEALFVDIVFEDSVEHETHSNIGYSNRNWRRPGAFDRMVTLRNTLLDRVCESSPDAFFSLDSDIFLTDPTTISKLYKFVSSGNRAANPLIYMSHGTKHPGTMNWQFGTSDTSFRGLPIAIRNDNFQIGERFKADVIMGAKMMSRDVYRDVRYRHHTQGEDLGWSYECGKLGKELFCLSDLYASHIMSPNMMSLFKSFGDDRGIRL